MPPPARPLLTVICPVHDEELCVPLLYDRLRSAMGPVEGDVDWELVFTNNRSTDRTAERILEIRARDPRVQMLTLSRNVGYQASVQAGLRHARGELIAILDVDCEDPPELIPRFIEEWRKGFDLVYGERQARVEPYWLTLLRRAFYRVNRLVADSDIILDMAEFSLMTSAMRDAVLAHRSTFPFVRMEIAAAGFERKGIPYDRQARAAGHSHYHLLRMTVFAVAGILSSTTLPLRAALYLLAVVVPLNLAWLGALALSGVWPLAGALAGGRAWQAVVVADLTYLCVFVAMLCLYLARTYRNGIGRPTAIVDWGKSAFDGPVRPVR